jgi:urease accessory protein
VFALFHGAAHVAELPSGIALGPYVAGFAAATVMLHAAGVAIGSALSRLGMLRLAGVPFLLAGTWLAMAAV